MVSATENPLKTPQDTLPKAIVLLSGGLDSAVVAGRLVEKGFAVYALTVDYGQRHSAEINASRKVAAALQVKEHLILTADLRGIGGSALTSDVEVPKGDMPEDPVVDDIPVTYVPARNAFLLSVALGMAEARGAERVGIGVNALDWSGYPDCRPEFIDAFQKVSNVGTKAGAEGHAIKIYAPLLNLGKDEIVGEALRLGVDLDITLSCYDPDPSGEICGLCDACRLRYQAEGQQAKKGVKQ